MEDEAGIPVKDRQVILNKIFGKEGLTETTDVYNTLVMNIRSIIDENDNAPNGKKIRLYFDNKLLPLLKAHVIEPAKRGKIEANWTNNNLESANYIMKSAISWNARDMPKFIEIVYNIVKGQEIERGSAIRDMGKFQTLPCFPTPWH